MRVLDIYPNYCWSFESESKTAIKQLRAAVSIADEAVRDSELNQVSDGCAYHLIGDATAFELADDFFDEIRVEYSPTILKRLILAPKVNRWLKPDGRLLFPPEEPTQTSSPEHYVPLRHSSLVPA